MGVPVFSDIAAGVACRHLSGGAHTWGRMRGRSFRGLQSFALIATQKGVARKALEPRAALPCCAGFVVPAQQGKAAAVRNSLAGACGGRYRQG